MEPIAGGSQGGARRTLVVTGACFVALALVVTLAGTPPGDVPVREALLALAAPPVLAAMHAINHAGSWPLLLPATLVLVVAFAAARRRWYVWVALMVAASLAPDALKWLVGRPRPEALSLGFPSGNATAAAAFSGALIYLAAALPPGARRLTRTLAVTVVALVALARVMLRAHWPSDALAGVALGLALASVAALLSSSSADLARARRGS